MAGSYATQRQLRHVGETDRRPARPHRWTRPGRVRTPPARLRRDGQGAVAGIDVDRAAVGDLALEQQQRRLVADLALDDALERAGAEGGVEALASQVAHRRRRDVELDAPLAQPLAPAVELDADDRGQVGLGERLEADDL